MSQLGTPRSARPRRAMIVGLAALVGLTGIGASCSGASRETTPSVPEVAEARLPRTDLRLLVITDLMGYLEPCGCTSRPLGGIDRLAAALREARSGSAPTLFVSAGDLFFDGTSHGVEVAEAATQEIWKAETVADVLSQLELAAAVPGPLDLRFGAERLEALRARARFPLLAAPAPTGGSDVAPTTGGSDAPPGSSGSRAPAAPTAGSDAATTAGSDAATTTGSDLAAAAAPAPAHVVREVGGVRVGLVGVSDIAGADDAAMIASARREVSAVRDAGAQLVIVLARAPRRIVRRIATGVPGIDFVVQGGADDAAPHVPASTEGATILHASHHGQGLLVVDVMRGEDGAWTDASTWTRTDERDRLAHAAGDLRARIAEWERDESVAAADLAHQRARLAEMERQTRDVSRAPEIDAPAFTARFVELPPEAPRDEAITSVLDRYFRRVNEHNRAAFASLLPTPAPEGRPSYVGTATCGTCHEEALSWWRGTMHGHAYRTLQDLHKEYNLSCVGCHVTGYQQPGGSTVAHVGELQDVGCENCHGPGSMHVADPAGALIDVRRDAPEEVCVGCHNPEHSDRFHYPTYRRMMIAPGHGMPSVEEE